MTWSAPIDRAVSTFLVLHTAVTSAPNDLAIWTANVPTPPDAPFNQNLVAWLDASLITKTLKGGDCRDWYGCCVVTRTVGWLQRQLIFNSTHILGQPSPCETCYPEHLVAWMKLLD